MRRRTLLAIGLLTPGILILAGCASLSKNQCLKADWYAVGLFGSAVGRPLGGTGDHRRACAEYNVTPQTERYLGGRNEGLKTFCNYERGYSNGRAGYAYVPVCAAESGFSAGYQRGRELHDLTQRLTEVRNHIARTQHAIAAGTPNPAALAIGKVRLEDTTREAQELEWRISRASNP